MIRSRLSDLFLLLQEQFWRSVMFHNHFDYLAKNGYEYEESAKNQAIREQHELLLKMFAVSKINILKKLNALLSLNLLKVCELALSSTA